MGVPKHKKQVITNMKEGSDSNTIIVGNFNIPLKSMDISKKEFDVNIMNAIMEALDFKYKIII